MDIPETGAIFSLGKSHLIENSQSYFFVKNDPVKRLVSGSNQSAVICESGRLFVWGENQFGQLGIGGTPTVGEIITKPTCVKSLKTLGLKVCDVTFGIGWCAILTHTNEIFFTGRNIFAENTKTYQNFTIVVDYDSNDRRVEENEKIRCSKRPFRLEEFDGMLEDNNQDEIFYELSSGNEHFVVLTSHGRLFGWGANHSNQLGLIDEEVPLPVEIRIDCKIKGFACGPKSTIILTTKNQLFLTGLLNEFHFPEFTELILNFPQENIIFLQISQANEIFIVTEIGNIYRSTESVRNNNLLFHKFYDYDNEENGAVIKLLKGNSFFAALTKNSKLFTTFSESGHHLKTFREISKFKNLKILDFAIGDEHVLVMGIPRSGKPINSASMNKTYTIAPDLIVKKSNGSQINGYGLVNGHIDENENYDEENELKFNENSSPFEKKDQIQGENVNDIKIKDVSQTIIPNSIENEGIKIRSPSGNSQRKLSGENSTLTLLPSSALNEKKLQLQSEINQKTPDSHISPSNDDMLKIDSPRKSQNSPNPQNCEDFTIYSNGHTSREEDLNSINIDTSSRQSSGKQSVITMKSLNKPISANSTENKIENIPRQVIEPSAPFEKDLDRHILKSGKFGLENDKMDELFKDILHQQRKVQEIEESIKNVRNDAPKIIEVQKKELNDVTSSFDKSPPKDIGTSALKSRGTSSGLQYELAKTPSSLKTSPRSIKFDEKSLKSQKSSERFPRPRTPYPDGGQGTPQTVLRLSNLTPDEQILDKTSPKLTDSLENIPEVSPQSSEKKNTSNTGEGLNNNKLSDLKQILPEKIPVRTDRAMIIDDEFDENDENLAVEVTDSLDQTTRNEIRFINNGIDVTKTVESTEELEITSVENDDSDEIKRYVMAEKASAKRGSGISRKSMKQIKQEDLISIPSLKDTEKEVDSRGDPKPKSSAEDERTTASVNSNKTENSFGNESTASERDKDLSDEIDIEPESRKKKVKRFLVDLKNKGKEMSCKNQDSVQVEDEPPKYTPVEKSGDNKTSKVCTIL